MVPRHLSLLESVLDTSDFDELSRSSHLQLTYFRENFILLTLMIVTKVLLNCKILIVFWQNLTMLLNIVLRILINNLEMKKLKHIKINRKEK